MLSGNTTAVVTHLHHHFAAIMTRDLPAPMPPLVDNTPIGKFDYTINILVDGLRSGPYASTHEREIQQLKEIKRPAREFLEPLDEEALKAAERSLKEFFGYLNPVRILLASLGLRFVQAIGSTSKSNVSPILHVRLFLLRAVQGLTHCTER